MLTRLHIENFALISEITLDLEKGLTVLTGETGSGKSILLGALGLDYDSFGLEAGSEYFLKAQTIVANAQNTGGQGWLASQGKQNRYWLIENLLSQTFRPLRLCMYNYHRKGFDLLESDLEGARLNIADALIEMRSTNRIRPGSFNLQVFFLAKSDEIIKLFSPAPEAERVRLLPVLKQMDPGNISQYDEALL